MSGTITPMTSWKIDVSHWPVVTEMPKSDTMVGSAALKLQLREVADERDKGENGDRYERGMRQMVVLVRFLARERQDRLWRLLLRLLPLLWPPSLPLLPWTSRFGRGFVSGSIFFSN